LREHVELEVEAIDRMYLNVYVKHLQSVGAVVGYLRVHRGQRFASTAEPVVIDYRRSPRSTAAMIARPLLSSSEMVGAEACRRSGVNG